MFAQAQVGKDGQALPQMPTGALQHGDLPTGGIADKTAAQRNKIKNLLRTDQRGKDQTVSPELRAQFTEFKKEKDLEASQQRQAMTDSLRSFSSSQKTKETAAPAEKKKPFSFNINAKSFSMNAGAKEFVPNFKKAAAPAATPAAAPPAPRQAAGYGQHPGHMQGGPGFGPGGQFQQGGFPQQLPQQMMAMGPQLAEPEQIHNSDKPVADLYASGINKMLTSTPYDVDDKANLPGWPFGNISFRNPDEQRQQPPAAYGMQGMQGGYPQQQMMVYPQQGGYPPQQQQYMMQQGGAPMMQAPAGYMPQQQGMMPQGQFLVQPQMMQQQMHQQGPGN